MARKRSEGVRSSAMAVASLALLVLPLGLAPRVEAFVYWTDAGLSFRESSIGRANLDGTDADPSFITTPADSCCVAGGVAVDAAHIYWGSADGVGRADLDGSGVDPSFISTGFPSAPARLLGGVAVDAAHVYWTQPGARTIGRANLDGSGVKQSFISTPSGQPEGIAVDGAHIYWTNETSFGDGTIARANLDGTGVDPTFISTPGVPGPQWGVAVDAAHIYWTRFQPWAVAPPCCSGTFSAGWWIARANLDGSGVDPSFAGIIYPGGRHGQGLPGIAVDAAHIYWTDWEGGAIGRANLDGSGIDPGFVFTDSPITAGLAADALSSTPGEVSGTANAKKTQRQRGHRVRVTVKVKAKERLTATASGKVTVNPSYKLKAKEVRLAAHETRELRLKPKQKAAKSIIAALKRGEKAQAKLKVKLTDAAGNSETEKLRVRLKR